MKIGALFVIAAGICAAADSDYADSRICATCHANIAERYAKTAMARSFSSSIPKSLIRDFYHEASDTHFAMLERDSKLYQRRWQTGAFGTQVNIDEKSIDYVMGSGSHVRTFLHRTASGALQELPLAWYSENGGTWAMNPGYDQPQQPNSRRRAGYECMFCHNSYPQIPAGHDGFRAEALYSGALPEGIDCQRCHGPGRAHVESGGQAAIVNPKNLSPERQMDVCQQCHLETTSSPLPASIVRYNRGPFSYRPGEPLSDFALLFDTATGKEDRFEIVSSAYRLRMSACFLKSAGRLTCTTCHDPHSEGRDTNTYNATCQSCHATLSQPVHARASDCVSCHMPKRRTDDVVHVVMTDHRIQLRRPVNDLLAPRAEPHGPDMVYHGEVVPYDQSTFPRAPESELYLALAQIRTHNNSVKGILQFEAALEAIRPKQAEFYIELGDELRTSKRSDPTPIYKEAIARAAGSVEALLGLAEAQVDAGNSQAAIATLRQVNPSDKGEAWSRLGQAYVRLGIIDQAQAALKKSLEYDPEIPETHYALAAVYLRQNHPDLAEASYREAIRLQPDYSAAHSNLAIFLYQTRRPVEARQHFETAIRYNPGYALGHYNYALMLRAEGKRDDALRQLEQAIVYASSLDSRTLDEAKRARQELLARP